MNNKKRDRDTLENNNEYIENNNKNNNIVSYNDYDINNNNSNYNNEYNIKLYNSVFNNIYIKRIILNHLNKYNILSSKIIFHNIEEWQQFKYKQYLYSIGLLFKLNLNQLPENIKQVSFPKQFLKRINKQPNNNNNLLPSHIESVWIFNELKIKNINNMHMAFKEKLIKLELGNMIDKVLNYKLPQSLTELTIDNYGGVILKNVLPNNLKRLRITEIKSFEDGCFPQSLEDVDVSGPPSLLKQFSNGTFKNLKKLMYYCINDDPIDNDIQFQKSNINCNTNITRLPDNLKYLCLPNQYKYDIQFPSSLEYLYLSVINKSNRHIFENQQSVPINLKTIRLKCSSLIDSNGNSILPNYIEKLILFNNNQENFNHEIKANHLPSSLTCLYMSYYFNQKIHQLPSSLTYLKLGRLFNQVIDVNVLPSTLKSLIIENFKYSQLINPLAIPKQLRLLDVCCFELDISPLKTLSTTHLNTVIVIDDKKRFLSEFYDASNTQIRVLRLPHSFDMPLSTLQLQDKSNLEYLHLGFDFYHPIQLSDLPSPNNIKTLVLSKNFRNIINLEHFQNVETIVVQPNSPFPEYCSRIPTITSTKDQNGCYNTYNLKTIYANPYFRDFLNNLDFTFYQFLKRYTPDSVNY